MYLEPHCICIVRHEFQHTALVSLNVGNHTNFFCHAMIVGN